MSRRAAWVSSVTNPWSQAPSWRSSYKAGDTLRCRGRVAWSKELLRSEVMPVQGFRNGVALEDLTGMQLDVLQHLCSHYAVSRQYHDISFGDLGTARRGASNGPLPAHGRGLEGPSFAYRLPVVLEVPGDGAKTAYAC